MNYDKIKQLIASLANKVENEQKIAVPILAIKLARHCEHDPHDQTIGAMNIVIDKMNSNGTLFISRAELKNLYSKLYSNGTNFAEAFKDELGEINNKAEIKKYNRDETISLNPYKVGDQVLANALNSVFDNKIPLKMYSQNLADKAKISVFSTLDAWGLKPSNINIDDGNEKFLVVKADYDTPKGLTSFFVPVQIKESRLLEPSIFVGNTGPQDLNNTNIKSYLLRSAGTKLTINASIILGALVKSASENRQISNVELALIKLNNNKQNNSEFFEGQIIGQKIAEASEKQVELPRYHEFDSFEKKFASPSGQAMFKFGNDKINTARDTVVREFLKLGYNKPQLTITNSDNSTIFYGISLDGRTAFTIPVKVAEKIQIPNVMLFNGSLLTLNKENINKLYAENRADIKVTAAVSPQFGLKPSDLINNIRQATLEGNISKAEDALNVLANTNDKKAYAVGFKAFVDGLGNKKPEISKCSMVIRNNTSEKEICGHTGLTLDKVYQDKHGNCCPLYRKEISETYEGASFMNSKIFG